MNFLKLTLAIVILLCSWALASASDISSAYTKIDLDQCRLREAAAEEGTFGGSWDCAGYAGIPVYVMEGDLRMFVSFGTNAAAEIAAEQTLPNFNTINETLEWRLRGGRPFAAILRWFLDDGEGGKAGSVLIVTQLVPRATCQVARVDAGANRNANVLARQAADQLAGNFDCNQPPVIIGNPGSLY